MKPMLKLVLAVVAIALVAPVARAQNTSGVPGPVVNAGEAAAQYRATYDPDTDGFAQRLHYERAINGELKWRVVAATRKTAASDIDFDQLRGELFWQVSPDDRAWQTGFRFDAVLRNDNRPTTLGANWTNQISLGDGWSARAVLLTAVETGDTARDGIFLQTRGQLDRKLGAGRSAGLQLFSAYGSTDGLADFNDQSHQLGPYLSVPVNDQWSVVGGALFGLTDASADTNLRVWLTRRF